MEFIVQHNLMKDQSLQLIKEAIKPYPHRFVGVIPFSREITSDDPIEGFDFIPYGSTLFTYLALEKQWKGLFYNLKNDYKEATLNRNDMLNGEIFLTAKEVVDKMNREPATKEWFIRPSLDMKHFTGTVMPSKEILDWFTDAMLCDSSGSYKIDDDLCIVLAEPKTIQAEWRWFIVNGRVISGSMYRAHGQMKKEKVTETEVIKEAQSFADGWLPSPCCVMDLALVNDKLSVIEFNCINSSGFYDNDVNQIAKSLFEYCTK